MLAAPNLGGIADFDKAEFGLHLVAVEEWGGFVWLCLTPDAAPKLCRRDGRCPRRLGNYPLEDLRSAKVVDYEVQANWKLILESYNECYHCAGVHPELCEIVPEFRNNGGMHLDWEAGIPHREGATTYTMSGTTDRAALPGLSEEEKVRHKGELLYPNLMFSISSDHAAALILWPEAVDRTRIECRFLFHKDEIARPGFRPVRRGRFLGSRQPAGLGGVRTGPARHGGAGPRSRLLLADGGLQPRYPPLHCRSAGRMIKADVIVVGLGAYGAAALYSNT